MTTLLLWFHPEPTRSRANRALFDAASEIDGVEPLDMGALHPDPGTIAPEAERDRLERADRLVLQFPIHWYLPPPLLAAWQNIVLTRLFYVHPEEGARLAGLPFRLAVTAGNTPEAYAPDGINRHPLADLLHPLEATASRCGFAWADPFIVYGANRLDDEARASTARRYADWIAGWTDGIARGRAEP